MYFLETSSALTISGSTVYRSLVTYLQTLPYHTVYAQNAMSSKHVRIIYQGSEDGGMEVER